MAKADGPTISEATIEMLEGQVKKGKARKFFLIFKGSSIKTLVVFKKGPFGPKILSAKKEGFKGEVCYGVVTGSGKNLFFQLPGNFAVASAMKVDGVSEQPPTKKAKLREFLNDAGLSFKPEYVMVTKVADAVDPEVDSDIPAPPPPPGTIVDEPDQDAAVPETQPAPDQDEAARFKERLAAILPQVKNAAALSGGQEVKLKVSEAGVFARKQDFEQAHLLFDQAEKLLASIDPASLFKARLSDIVKQIKQAAGTAAGDAAKLKASEAGVLARKQDFVQAFDLLDEAEQALENLSPTSDDDKAKTAKLAAALKKLGPLIDKVSQSDASRAGELQATKDQIVGELRNGELENATQNIRDFATLLKSLAVQATAATATDDGMAIFTKRRDSVESDLLQAQSMAPDRATQLNAIWQYAWEQADSGNFEKAFKALDRLTPAVEEILKSVSPASEDLDQPSEEGEDPATVVPSLAKYRAALLEYGTARSSVQQQVQTVAEALRKELPDESDLADELEDQLNQMNDQLWDVIDDEINADDEDKAKRARVVRSQLQQMLGQVETNRLIAIVDQSPLVSMSIKQTLAIALNRILSQIAA